MPHTGSWFVRGNVFVDQAIQGSGVYKKCAKEPLPAVPLQLTISFASETFDPISTMGFGRTFLSGLLLSIAVRASDNGLARTPQMGWVRHTTSLFQLNSSDMPLNWTPHRTTGTHLLVMSPRISFLGPRRRWPSTAYEMRATITSF
jgi:hypothetical protein